MNSGGMDSGGGHHPHSHHHAPPEHHAHYQYHDPQTGQPYPPSVNYANYPNYQGYGYGYPHDSGAPPPPPPHPHHHYHDGQYYPPPPAYYGHPEHYPIDHLPLQQHTVKVDGDPYYNQPPQHHVLETYRMDEIHPRQLQLQVQAPPQEDKVVQPVVEAPKPVQTQIEPMQEETVDAPSPEVAEYPAAAEEGYEQKFDKAKEEAEISEHSNGSIDLFSDDKVFPFGVILDELQSFKMQHGHANIPVSHPVFARVIDVLIEHGIEKETDMKWESQFAVLKEYKDKHGDCDIPFTDPTMGDWMALHRKLHADGVSDPLTLSRFAKLDEIGFEWDLPKWDQRLKELTDFAKEHKHTDVPLKYPGGLGVWVINQKFNIHDMPKERQDALDAIGFIWNHNRKRRSDKAWNLRYDELLEYIKKHKTANVPTTAGHSKLSKWVGKQREEYKKFINKESSQLDRTRIDRLNAIGFQWSLQQWTVVPWEDRFDALKKFKEEHGHLKIPRNHPYFGNWPNWQRTQYKLYRSGKASKITKDKVDKLISIGFFKPPDKQSEQECD
ncbi:hypothetical protein ACHAW6_001565 [Cyclotella cf. meneghiniana]